MKRKLSFLAVLVLGLPLAALAEVPQLINYQGRVAAGGTNYSGTGQFQFALVDGGSNTARCATGSVTVTSGFVTAIPVSDGGAGYTVAPTVSITDASGSGAGGIAILAGGAVASVTVTNTGHGYTPTPTVAFSAPPVAMRYVTYWSNGTGIVSLPVSKGLYSVLLGDTALANMSAIPLSVFANSDVRLRVWFGPQGSALQPFAPDQRLAAVGYAMVAGSVDGGAISGAIRDARLSTNVVLRNVANNAAGSICWGGGSSLDPASGGSGGSIELGNSTLNGTVPFIDFHYGVGGIQDFNVRLINDASNHLSCFGAFEATSLRAGGFVAGSDGNVGIGTATPGYPLVVQKRSVAEPAIMIGGGFAGGPRLQTYGLDENPAAWCGLGNDMSGGTWEHDLFFPVGPSSDAVQSIGTYDGTTYSEKMRITAGGHVASARQIRRPR